jgi:hypothetical protein
MAVLPRPVDCLVLSLVGLKDVIGVVLRNTVLNTFASGRRASTNTVALYFSFSRLQCSTPDAETIGHRICNGAAAIACRSCIRIGDTSTKRHFPKGRFPFDDV